MTPMNMRRIIPLCAAAALMSTGAASRAQDAPEYKVMATGTSARIHAQAPTCRPEYPMAAVRKMAQGTSVLRFSVDATGKVTAVDIVQSAGPTPEHQLLDQAAAQALAKCDFTPGRGLDGQPVATQVQVTYTWKLE
jgi:protein TonB